MKTVSPVLQNHLRQAYNVYCKPKLMAEWNLNRYGSPTASNGAPEDLYGYDVELFPIESIVEPNRPGNGIAKAFIGQATVGEYSPTGAGTRYYVAGPSDSYKYWVSPVTTTSGTFPVYNQAFADAYEETDAGDGLTVARPTVEYGTAVQANKIVIGLENSYANPTNYSVWVKTTVGGAWSSVATNPAIDSDGRIILHRNGGAWSASAPSEPQATVAVAGIQLRVGGMSVSTAYLSVIEISARRVENLTSRLMETDTTSDLSAESIIYPIGTITTNTANLTLSNVDGLFDADNASSTYKDVLEPNVEFTLSYVYNVNGTDYEVQDFKMYGGPWTGQKTDTIDIECFDPSKFLQEIKPNRLFYMGLSVSEIVWRICDSVGFDRYNVTTVGEGQVEVPYFWTDGEQTVWQVFDELARATQTAIYFDSYGVLNIKSREAAFSVDAPDWVLKGEVDPAAPTELPDIIELEQDDEIGTNHVKVVYQKTEFAEDGTGFPVRETVWEPEGTLVLRATNLMSSIDASQLTLRIDANDAKLWPYSGIMQVEGELISYDAKRYVHYTGGSENIVWVSTNEKKKELDASTPAHKRHLNHFNGVMRLTERGLWNSEPKAHSVDISGYTVKRYQNETYATGVNGFYHQKAESTARLASTANMESGGEYLWAVRGASVDSPFYHLGTRIRLNSSGRTKQMAGLAFNLNGQAENGYYIQIKPTRLLEENQSELTLLTRVGGTMKVLGKSRKAVKNGRFYDVEVSIRVSGSNTHKIIVYFNGVVAITVEVSGDDKNTMGGRFGMFIRGSTDASFEYLYAVRRTDREIADESNWWDRVRTAYSSNQWDKEWVFNWTSTSRRVRRATGKERRRWNKMFMDEFGPIVHEVREFDVKFDPAPVLDSILFTSNGGILCPEYVGDSFGAKFILTNASRKNAVAHGEDTLAFAGSGESVNRVLFCYGRVAQVSEAEEVIAKNVQQIQARGKVETEISSAWIQNKESAKLIADWIKGHWSNGAEVITVTVFGNPLLELTDVVSVYHPEYNMSPATHEYFVTGISSNFSAGLETVLTLRRRLT